MFLFWNLNPFAQFHRPHEHHCQQAHQTFQMPSIRHVGVLQPKTQRLEVLEKTFNPEPLQITFKQKAIWDVGNHNHLVTLQTQGGLNPHRKTFDAHFVHHFGDFPAFEVFKPEFGLDVVQMHVFSNADGERDSPFHQKSQPLLTNEFTIRQQHPNAFYRQHLEQAFQQFHSGLGIAVATMFKLRPAQG